MERSLFLTAVDAALSLASSPGKNSTGLDYVQRVCPEWLARWPGDFRIRARLADACILSGEYDSAARQLALVIQADPEAARPYQTLSAMLRRTGRTADASAADGCLRALDASDGTTVGLPEWADPLLAAVRLLRSGRWQEARLAAETVLRAAPQQPLAALVHLQSLWRLSEHAVVLSAGREYRSTWPGCAAFLLLMAQSSFASGRNSEGVEFLHCRVDRRSRRRGRRPLFGRAQSVSFPLAGQDAGRSDDRAAGGGRRRRRVEPPDGPARRAGGAQPAGGYSGFEIPGFRLPGSRQFADGQLDRDRADPGGSVYRAVRFRRR